MKPRPRDTERTERIGAALKKHKWDALVCFRPMNVLMLSGYWPVLAHSVAVIMPSGEVSVVAPEDEEALARLGWADHVYTFTVASLSGFEKPSNLIAEQLGTILKPLQGGRVAYENSASTEPVTYVGMNVHGEAIRQLVGEALQLGSLTPASSELARLRAVLTTADLDVVRRACRIAKDAFSACSRFVGNGATEAELAAALRAGIGSRPPEDCVRADGFCFCMSGPNSSLAYKAYQRSTLRSLRKGEFVLLHCNSYVDGLWTDITRTYFLGDPGPQQMQMLEAVLEARHAAIRQIRPGILASAVDHAARQALESRGYGKTFRHATGHGVGFAAVDHAARPHIHPLSTDVLEPGMTFNVEPAIYNDGVCGIRHCDMVTVTQTGCEILTDFQSDLDELVLPARGHISQVPVVAGESLRL
jgi:Xaa-Pro aminopeptidase